MTEPIELRSGPFRANVPFANESQVQDFVEAHLKEIFGFDVIASTKRDRRRLFDIDILAIDEANRPVIIECKWDLVGERALEQLAQYKSALLSGWDRFEARVSELRGCRVRVEATDPIQITIGYRYDPLIIRGQQLPALCVSYEYENIQLAGEVLEKRRPGWVSIHRVGDLQMARSRHPKVSKKDATERRLEPFSPSAQNAFWSIDTKLKALTAVYVTYGGKNFVRYRVGTTLFAEAFIEFPSIQWRVTLPANRTVTVVSGSDEDKAYRVLREAHASACQG
jgi:hypothetical protein